MKVTLKRYLMSIKNPTGSHDQPDAEYAFLAETPQRYILTHVVLCVSKGSAG